MGIDGIFLYGLKREINDACQNARVDKIHQPSKEELVLSLRSAMGNRKLFISAKPSSSRIGFIEESLENPAEPPMFCMLLRKYLSGAKYLKTEDTGFERIAVFLFNSVNELGDNITVKLIVELIGKQTNIILVGNDGRIIDAVRRSDLETSSRIIQPGAKYIYPEKLLKLSICDTDEQNIVSAVCQTNMPLCSAIVSTVDGVSPLIARELAVRAGLDIETPSDSLKEDEKDRLTAAFSYLKTVAQKPLPTLLADKNGLLFEFSYMDITQYGNLAELKQFDSLSELVEAVFTQRDNAERIRVFAIDLVKLLANLRTRTIKKIAVRRKELEKCKDSDRLRIYGELLKANLYKIKQGAPYVEVENYYDPELKLVRIPLNVALSPALNAEQYFKEYKKYCNASSMLGGLIEQSEKELEYIESVIDELSRAGTVSELNEIKIELVEAGYLKLHGSAKKNKIKSSKPIETVSPDGFKVLIGRNNRQNDELTLKIADKRDVWFHTKNIPGSHVIVVTNGEQLPESTLIFAAELAAKNSKAAASSSVPVDYTEVKYVKKPVGAKPGMVIYKTNRTVYVTPKGGAL